MLPCIFFLPGMQIFFLKQDKFRFDRKKIFASPREKLLGIPWQQNRENHPIVGSKINIADNYVSLHSAAVIYHSARFTLLVLKFTSLIIHIFSFCCGYHSAHPYTVIIFVCKVHLTDNIFSFWCVSQGSAHFILLVVKLPLLTMFSHSVYWLLFRLSYFVGSKVLTDNIFSFFLVYLSPTSVKI